MKNASQPVTIRGVRCGKKGLRHEGKYCPVWYSLCTLKGGQVAITLYAKSVLHSIPAVLGNVENNTEMQSDYFESDRVRFNEGSPEFAALKPFCR